MKQVYGRHGLVLLAAVLLFSTWVSPAIALDVKLSGQVNQMALWADDGYQDDFFVTDNNSSSSRFRFYGQQEFGVVKAGFQIEFEAMRNESDKLTIRQNSEGDFVFNDRWINAYFATPYGTFEIGKGDGAANNTAEVDLSGTSAITYSRVVATAGGFVWKYSDGTTFDPPGSATSLSVSKTTDNFDGLSRNERIRYNTPQFAGFSAAASMTNGQAWETSLWYGADFYGKLIAAIGYVDTRRLSGNFTQWDGSVSWLAPFGLNITAAYGVRQFTGDLETSRLAAGSTDDATNYYGKLGYKWDIHAVAVEYGLTQDLFFKGEDSSMYGLAYVITPWKGVELYTAYRNYMLDVDSGPDPEDIQEAMAGTRIKF